MVALEVLLFIFVLWSGVDTMRALEREAERAAEETDEWGPAFRLALGLLLHIVTLTAIAALLVDSR